MLFTQQKLFQRKIKQKVQLWLRGPIPHATQGLYSMDRDSCFLKTPPQAASLEHQGHPNLRRMAVVPGWGRGAPKPAPSLGLKEIRQQCR